MILALLLAATPPVVAVLEFRDKVPADQRIDVAYLSDRVRAAVKENLPEARVITRENMLVLLQGTGKKLEECEGECEVDTGGRVGADVVISGELLRFGSQYKLNMKLHDTRSAELLSGSVAAGTNADELDRDLLPAVRKLLAPLLQNQLSDRRAEAKEEAESHRRILPGTVAAMWLTAGYASVSTSTAVTRGATSGFSLDLGGHLFFRALGPLYFGALVDYSLSGPNGLLAGAGARVALADVALSGGFGYADLAQSAGTGVGALAAVDFGVSSGLSLRLQGSWRRGKTTPGGLAATEVTTTVWSAMGGLSLQF
jgi:hypothetical protein